VQIFALWLHGNVSFCIAAKEILKIHFFADVKTADLIKKNSPNL
jgi:hypothetical protein